MDPNFLNNPRHFYTIQREIEEEIIRHEIIAAEIERRPLPEEEVRRELMIEREMAMRRAREMGLSIDDRLSMQLHTRYPWFPFPRNLGMGFGHDVLPPTLPHFSHRLWSGLDVDKKDKPIMLGKPDSNICGSKQKAATIPAGSGELPSASSNKPKEWSCALCQVSATTERGLDVHLQGKKHKAKVAGLLRHKKICSNSTSSMSKKSAKTRGGAGRKMKTNIREESVKANKTVVGLNQKVKGGLDERLQGKKCKAKVGGLLRDRKMCSNSTSSASKKSAENRGGAGQKMKTIVQEESVKAKKTVVGLNQKVKGGLNERLQGKKHKAKVAGLLRVKKMCSNSTSSTSKKSTESRGDAGQKMKTKVQEESVKANKTVVGLNQKVKGGLVEHLQGKKHKAKVAGLPRDKKMSSNSTSSTSKKSTESRGGAGQKMKTKVQEESVKANKTVVGLNKKVKGGLDEHPQGKKLKVNEELLGAQKWTKNSTESRDGVGQEMKTKVEEKSVKANKTVVGLDQKEEGGQALQVKSYPNLCGSKQESVTLPVDSGKLHLTSSKKPLHWSCALCHVSATSKRDLDVHLQGKKHKAKEEGLLEDQKMCCNSTSKISSKSRGSAGQKMKNKVQEESVKANKTVVGLDQKLAGGQDEHLQGKKHKAKEAELLRPQKMCTALSSSTSKESGKTIKLTESRDIAGQELKAKVEEESVKAIKTVVGLNEKVEGEDDLENKSEELPKKKDLNANTQKTTNGIPTGETMKRRLPRRENFEFWCEDCQLGTHSAVVMEGHKRGKKHMAWSNKSKKNDEAVPPTTSTTIATPSARTAKVEDEDVVAEKSNEETADSVIGMAEDEEVVVYRGRQSVA